jgi:hypothetical protein
MVSTPIAGTTDGAWHGAIPDGWSLKQLKWAITFQRGHDLQLKIAKKVMFLSLQAVVLRVGTTSLRQGDQAS